MFIPTSMWGECEQVGWEPSHPLNRLPDYYRADTETNQYSHLHSHLWAFRSSQLNLSAYLWTVKETRNPRSKPRQAQGQHADTTQKGSRVEPWTCFLWSHSAYHCAAVPTKYSNNNTLQIMSCLCSSTGFFILKLHIIFTEPEFSGTCSMVDSFAF